MIKKKINGLKYYVFEKLMNIDGLSHGVFTREGGVSLGLCQGLNIGFIENDRDENVERNRELVLKTIDGKRFVSTKQVHGTKVYVSGGNDCSSIESDAVITDRLDEALLIKTADCQSVILYDHRNRAIGNVHSGWRGSVQNIIGKTVEEMERAYGTDPSDIMAGIGPSLGPCCAEFKNYSDEIPEKYWKYQIGENHFDFWKISLDQLKESGVKEENIEIGGICTKCNPDLFYSYRYEKKTGRFGTVIMLKEKV